MKKIVAALAACIVCVAVSAKAQPQSVTPDPAVTQAQADWQAYLTQQRHVMESLDAVFNELAADRKRIGELEAENAKLRAVEKAKPTK